MLPYVIDHDRRCMIGNQICLTDDEREYLDQTIETLDSEVFVDRLGPEHFRELDKNEESREDWKEYVQRMAEHGFIGSAVPEEYNGAGDSYIETVLAQQAIGYCGTTVHGCQITLTQQIGGTLYEYGNDHLQENYLKPMLDGEYVVAVAFTEPHVGTDLAHLNTVAERDDDGWIVNGEKRFIDFAPYADFFLLPCRTSGEDGERDGISLVVVDGDADGIDILEDQSDWHGFRGTGASWMSFDSVRVPEENLVGEEGKGWEYLMNGLSLERLTLTRRYLGASQQALEIAVNYTAEREVNNRTVSDYQAVNHKVAEMATKLDAAYLLNTRAARVIDEKGIDSGRMESAMAKWYGTEAAHEIDDTCMQIMGGIGYTKMYPVERMQRDARAGRIVGGTTEVMKSIVQYDTYEKLTDEEFNGEFVGNELDGLPWRAREEKVASPVGDD